MEWECEKRKWNHCDCNFCVSIVAKRLKLLILITQILSYVTWTFLLFVCRDISRKINFCRRYSDTNDMLKRIVNIRPFNSHSIKTLSSFAIKICVFVHRSWVLRWIYLRNILSSFIIISDQHVLRIFCVIIRCQCALSLEINPLNSWFFFSPFLSLSLCSCMCLGI